MVDLDLDLPTLSSFQALSQEGGTPTFITYFGCHNLSILSLEIVSSDYDRGGRS